MLLTPHEITDAKGALPLEVKGGEITITDLVFGYGDLSPVYDKLSLLIPSGQKIALVGHSGILLPTRWSGNLPEALQRSEKVLTRSYARKVAVGNTDDHEHAESDYPFGHRKMPVTGNSKPSIPRILLSSRVILPKL
jgi:hypothetical protein